MLTFLLLATFVAEPDFKAVEPVIPKNFAEYFVRADAVKAGWIAKTEKDIELDKIRVNSVGAKEKPGLKSTLALHEEELKSLKRMTPVAGISPLEVGSIGFFENASTEGNVVGVIDKTTIVAEAVRNGKPNYFAVLKMKSTRGITTKSRIGGFGIHDSKKPDIWIVTSLNGEEKPEVAILLPARGRQAVAPVLEIVDQQLLEKYRAVYDAKTKSKPEQPIVPEMRIAMERSSDEKREYFERANAFQAELVAGIEKKIAGLETAIGDIDTLPIDKKQMEQELILVRAKLAQLKRAKPFAYLRRNPTVGDLGTLQSARVAAIHDVQSVIATDANSMTFRLTHVDAKSLKMRVGVKINEEEVWEVVAVNETPSPTISDSLKGVKLMVLKPVSKAATVADTRTVRAAPDKLNPTAAHALPDKSDDKTAAMGFAVPVASADAPAREGIQAATAKSDLKETRLIPSADAIARKLDPPIPTVIPPHDDPAFGHLSLDPKELLLGLFVVVILVVAISTIVSKTKGCSWAEGLAITCVFLLKAITAVAAVLVAIAAVLAVAIAASSKGRGPNGFGQQGFNGNRNQPIGGSDTCASCGGAGTSPFECACCGGTGLSGGGHMACGYCHGRRFSNCSSCNGTGRVSR